MNFVTASAPTPTSFNLAVDGTGYNYWSKTGVTWATSTTINWPSLAPIDSDKIRISFTTGIKDVSNNWANMLYNIEGIPGALQTLYVDSRRAQISTLLIFLDLLYCSVSCRSDCPSRSQKVHHF